MCPPSRRLPLHVFGDPTVSFFAGRTYTPDRRREELRQLLVALARRVVIVQPSVYGTDNPDRCGIRQLGPRARALRDS